MSGLTGSVSGANLLGTSRDGDSDPCCGTKLRFHLNECYACIGDTLTRVSVWVSVRVRSAPLPGLLTLLSSQVSTGVNDAERAPAPLESERPARDRGFESPRFRGSAVVRPSRVIVIGLVDNSG